MTIAVDFDGTIVTHEYPKIGKPIPFAIDTLLKLQEERHRIILWTAREGELLEDAVEYCKKKGLEFYAVNSNYPEENMMKDVLRPRKLTADLFIDDRNLGGIPEWGKIYQMVHSGHPHEPLADDAPYDRKPRRKSLLERLQDYHDRRR